MFDSIKNTSQILENYHTGGEYSYKERLGMLKNDFEIENREKRSKNLESFAKGSDSEREDEDIYNHYINKMNEAK